MTLASLESERGGGVIFGLDPAGLLKTVFVESTIFKTGTQE